MRPCNMVHKEKKEVFRMAADRPAVVCLCGSSRYGSAFSEADLRETLSGKIVLTTEVGDTKNLPREIKRNLDELHLRKIDIADEVLILNVNGYIGERVRHQLEYAQKAGKKVRYLE